mgnify:CR=1 FL=1
MSASDSSTVSAPSPHAPPERKPGARGGLIVLALVVLLAAAVATFFTSESGKQLIAFGRDAVKETKKVVWPTRKEAMQMTGYVFAFVVVMALFLFLTDKTLEWVLYDLILGWKR